MKKFRENLVEFSIGFVVVLILIRVALELFYRFSPYFQPLFDGLG